MEMVSYIQWLFAKIEKTVRSAKNIEYHITTRSYSHYRLYDATIRAKDKEIDIRQGIPTLLITLHKTARKSDIIHPLADIIFDKNADFTYKPPRDPLEAIKNIRKHIEAGRLRYRIGYLQIKGTHIINVRKALIKTFSNEMMLVEEDPTIVFHILGNEHKKYIEITPTTRLYKVDDVDIIAEVL